MAQENVSIHLLIFLFVYSCAIHTFSCLSICLSIYTFIHSSTVSLFLSFYLSSVYWYVYLSFYLTAFLSVSPSTSFTISPSFHLFTDPPVYPPVCIAFFIIDQWCEHKTIKTFLRKYIFFCDHCSIQYICKFKAERSDVVLYSGNWCYQLCIFNNNLFQTKRD